MNSIPKTPFVLLETLKPDRYNHRTLFFRDPVAVVTCEKLERVAESLDEIDHWIKKGFYAAGYISYEAGLVLEPAVGKNHPKTTTPLLWFGIFDKPHAFAHPPVATRRYSLNPLRPSASKKKYVAAVETVREYIRRGDTYQINYTFSQPFSFSGSDYALYRDLCERQKVAYAAFLRTDTHSMISLSPELFFTKRGTLLEMKPMKGTMRRGRFAEEDASLATELSSCPKNRSENLMIVDLLRNDLGRVARPGSVAVRDLFEVQRFETLHQMISTVSARVKKQISLHDLCRALFPSGSVTGAPKIRAMQIISELEKRPRGIYTGAVGYCAPNGDMAFNVAIRTLSIDRKRGMGELGIGSGIVYDSDPEKEYEECLLKARFMMADQETDDTPKSRNCKSPSILLYQRGKMHRVALPPFSKEGRGGFACCAARRVKPFQLIETILWQPGKGYFLLSLHLERLRSSAEYFGFSFSVSTVRSALAQATAGFRGSSQRRVRLTFSSMGAIEVESSVFDNTPLAGSVRFSRSRVNDEDVFLFHKTTCRKFYDTELAAARKDGCFDVIFTNQRGEVTEGAISNIVASIGGKLFTPPVSSGLLNGVYRRHLIAQGKLFEKVLYPADIRSADTVFMINSVRGMVAVHVQERD